MDIFLLDGPLIPQGPYPLQVSFCFGHWFFWNIAPLSCCFIFFPSQSLHCLSEFFFVLVVASLSCGCCFRVGYWRLSSFPLSYQAASIHHPYMTTGRKGKNG